jgi:hypothetical protein
MCPRRIGGLTRFQANSVFTNKWLEGRIYWTAFPRAACCLVCLESFAAPELILPARLAACTPPPPHMICITIPVKSFLNVYEASWAVPPAHLCSALSRSYMMCSHTWGQSGSNRPANRHKVNTLSSKHEHVTLLSKVDVSDDGFACFTKSHNSPPFSLNNGMPSEGVFSPQNTLESNASPTKGPT